MKKFAFTLPEIVVSMVVMAIVAAVAIPITKDKLAKVDYATYYLGYRVAQTIATDVLPSIIDEIDENDIDCKITIGNTCYTTLPFKPTPMSYSTCAGENATSAKTNTPAGTYGQSLGINACYYANDYWAGIAEQCGGASNIPTTQELEAFLEYVHDGTGLIEERIASLGVELKDGEFVLWGPESTYYTSYAIGYRDSGDFYTASNRDINQQYEPRYGICRASAEDDKEYASVFLTKIKNTLTKTDDNSTTTTPVSNVKNASTSTTGDFSSLKPHVTLSNGVKVFIGSDYGEIDILNDSVDEMDREGFIIYIDVDGSNNRTRLYEDVYPFYLVKSGKVIPGFKDGTKAGANNAASLAFNLHADKFDASGNRLAKLLNAVAQGDDDPKSFRAVACSAGYVTSTKYCGVDPKTITMEGINCHTSETADCRIKVKAPIRILN